MALFPLLLIPLVFVAGCSLFKEDQPDSKKSASPNPTSKKPDLKEISYRRSCLSDEFCPWPERKAAISDYVGAVYGKDGEVRFVESQPAFCLTPQENRYVEKKFGRLEMGEENIGQFLSRAKGKYFRDLNIPPDPACTNEPNRNPKRISHKELGIAFALGGRHGCGQKYADQLIKNGLELSIAANPSDWVFFLEGYGTKVFDKVKLEEMELFQKIAKTLDIPLKNPLKVSASSLEARKIAASETDYTVEDFAVSIVFQVAATASFQNPRENPQWIFQSVIEKLAPELEMNRDDLFIKTRQFLRDYPSMPSQIEESEKRAKILAKISNRLNQKSLKKELEELSKKNNKSKTLFVMGAEHLPLVESVYKSEKK